MMNPASLNKPSPLAAILIFGRISGVKLPQAAWFRADEAGAATESAKQLQLSVIEIKTEEERALTIGVQEGVTKGSGRAIIAPVSEETFEKMVEYLKRQTEKAGGQQLSSQSPSIAPADPAPEAAKVAPSVLSPDAPWVELKVGSLVVAAYFDEKQQLDGWWPAVVKGVEGERYVLKWRDAPDDPLFKAPRKYIAVLHRDYLISPIG